MGKDMEASRNHSNSGRHADTHVDIPNLRNRRVGKHTFHTSFPHSVHRPHNHASQTKHKQNVNDLQLQHNIYGKYAVNELDSKENIAFQYQTGQHPTGCRNCRLISAGQHGMEREKRALDGKTDEHKTCYHQQRECILSCCHQLHNSFLHLGEQQVSCNTVQDTDTQQNGTRPQQTDNQIVCGTYHCLGSTLCHNEGTGSNGQNFNKYISCENVVCICQCQHRTKEGIKHNEVKTLFFRHNIMEDKFLTACGCQQHNHAEDQCHHGFQRACTQFVAPRRGKMPHHECEGFPCGCHIHQQNCRHNCNNEHHQCMHLMGSLSVLNQRCNDAAEHCQKNAEEGNVMYPIHMLHHSPSLSLDNRMISSIFNVP